MSKSAAKPVAEPVVAGNYTITLHNPAHPGNRSSYTIPGRAGSVVIANALFKDGKAPATITLDCPLAEPKAKVEPKAKAITGTVAEVAPAAKVKGTKAA